MYVCVCASDFKSQQVDVGLQSRWDVMLLCYRHLEYHLLECMLLSSM